jgi:hypothetical protein
MRFLAFAFDCRLVFGGRTISGCYGIDHGCIGGGFCIVAGCYHLIGQRRVERGGLIAHRLCVISRLQH